MLLILYKLTPILVIALFFLILHLFFPIAFFLTIVVPFLMLKKVYQNFVVFMNKHNLWWELPIFVVFILLIILVVLYYNGYRY